ncbi:hypothetical protein A2U01_0101110, partial [Trifolium medium]|nr:hypothetical protein [Trifolium medium]
MTEFWSILSALQAAMEKGYRRVCVESDSAVAINLIDNGCPPNHP